MTTESHINQLFNNLDAWRHLPAYQLERRADIFFSLYLAEALKEKFGLQATPVLITEFPCRYGSIHEGGNNQSFKVDYLAVSVEDEKAFFVELKTDIASRNDDQDTNMKQAKQAGLAKLLSGLREMQSHSKQSKKYQVLLDDLALQKVPRTANYPIEIIYIQPKKSADAITFDDFAKIVEQKPDYLSLRFAKSLREWAANKAGNPKEST